MSNHLISAAYKRDLRTPMRKSLMALMADKASDDGGGIYASKQTMADELCCSRQAVIDTIKAFRSEGLLVVRGERRVANGHTVEYSIVVDQLEALPLVKCHADREERKRASSTRKAAGPVNQVDPSTWFTSPVNQVDPNPPKPVSTEATPPTKQRARRVAFIPPSDVPAAEWEAFEDMRRKIGKPLTDKARELAIERLRKFADDGWPPGDVLNHSILNNYQGLYPPKDGRNGPLQSEARSNLRGSRPDPAVDLRRYADALAAEEAASGDSQADRGFGLPLPSYLTD